MTPNADESARILTAKIQGREPFSFWRFGDGFLELMARKQGQTCDHEPYSEGLRVNLERIRNRLVAYEPEYEGGPVFFGDWQAASFRGPHDPNRYKTAWDDYFGSVVPACQLLHPECLLFMYESQALADFYRAVIADPRPKVYLGPAANAKAAQWLGAQHICTPMSGLHEQVEDLTVRLACVDFEVLLFGAGLAGMIPVFRAWQAHPQRTFIHVGSAFDPIGRGKSRKQQLTREQCWSMFK